MEEQAPDQPVSPQKMEENRHQSSDAGELKAKIKEKSLTNGSGDSNGLSNHASSNHEKSGKSRDHSSPSKHHSSSSSSSKHKDSSSSHKHRDGHSSSSKDGHRSSKDGHSSSKDGHSSSKNGHSSSKDGHSSSKDGHKSSSSSKHSSSSSKHRESSSSSHSKDKHSSSSDKHSSSSSDKHKHSSSSDKHKERSKDGSHKSSSSSDRTKESSSSKDKHRDKESSSSKDKHHSDKHRDKDRHKESSSSSKDKHSSSSSKDKESSSSRKDKESSSSSKDKHRSDSEKVKIKVEPKSESPVKIKEEKTDIKIKIKEEIKEEKRDRSPNKSPTKLTSPMSSPRSDSEKSRKVKKEPVISDDEDDAPLSIRIKSEPKRKYEESSDDEPLSARMDKAKKVKKENTSSSKKRKSLEDEEDDFKPGNKAKKIKKEIKKEKKATSGSSGKEESPKKKVKKEKEEEVVWKWWEEEKKDDGVKWKTLEHKGPVFAPPYEPLPDNVKFYYNGKVMKLSEETEEVATFYGKMLDHDYTTKEAFNTNFYRDWKKVMTKEEKEVITDLKKCNFREMCDYFKEKSEERKALSKEQKKENREANERITAEYGFCMIDGHKEKIGNFRIEPPGLFRGRGEHPKQGMLKKRVQAEEIIINCGKNSVIPVPPAGHKWKEVRYDNQVTWLASWNENIQGQTKYIMLNAASKLKGEKDWAKYEVARKLHKCVDKIRANYYEDFKSKEMRIRQRSVALYFIDKLALRAGNEKEEGETADTVGCCSLRVEHVKLYEEKDDSPYVVEFDFLGKDSIRYTNAVPVEKRVFKNLELFTQNKQPSDDLFDRLNTTILNKHLHDLMEGLTAKVFRTYNASRTLQEQLNLLTEAEDAVPAKILSYNRANRAVAVLCNHQRAVPKTFAKSMQNMMTKIDDKKKTIHDAKKNVKEAKVDYKQSKTDKNRNTLDRKKKILERLEEQLQKLEVAATDRDENKDIALGTSKLNYLDPRISVAWCKKFNVPIEKIYNKTQRQKFRWAIDMAEADFTF